MVGLPQVYRRSRLLLHLQTILVFVCLIGLFIFGCEKSSLESENDFETFGVFRRKWMDALMVLALGKSQHSY